MVKNRFCCTSCRLHKSVKNYVMGDSKTAVDIVFLDETPSAQANGIGTEKLTLGYKVLEIMVKEISDELEIPLTFDIIPITFCIAKNGINGDIREPHPDEVLACMDNVFDRIIDLRPRIVFFLTKVVEKYYKGKISRTGPVLIHPQIIANQGGNVSKWWLPVKRKIMDIVSLQSEIA